MPDPRLVQALWQWEDAQEKGESSDPKRFFPDEPELAREMQRRIGFLLRLDGRDPLMGRHRRPSPPCPRRAESQRQTWALWSACRPFEQEARITALLQHPGIVPVHNLGRLPDGRLSFTMKLVRGHPRRNRQGLIDSTTRQRQSACPATFSI